MKRNIIMLSVITAVCSLAASAINVSFPGSTKGVINITPERSTGLDNVFVVYNITDVREMRISGVSANAVVSAYSNLGGGYAQPVSATWSEGSLVVSNPEGDMGYIVDNAGKYSYFWVVDYSHHKLNLQHVYPSAEQDCDNTRISVDGTGDAIYFYTIDGRREELSRDIRVAYSTLVWDETSDDYLQKHAEKIIPHISSTVTITPPIYCSTTFAVSGDRFLQEWGIGEEIESSVMQPNGLSVHTTAIQTNVPTDSEESDASNVIKVETEGMGGSAPVDMEFRAKTTDAVIHNEWQIAADESFEYTQYRFNEQNVDYTFNEEGTYYVRFVGSNADGSCETYGDTYTICIGASELRVPNAFTPNGDGVNDIWKVSYRSLTSFRCWIFDRYGNELFQFSDPSQGWDGKYKGKLVNPGVYFYVIEATGADGNQYKKGGDINILKARHNSTTGTQPPAE
ncbi:MAG: gliding motility-associated C-terminal domain-containing protein [Candidatus Amulumruptor caecigallinarius]|nr:gliding motility-associated C-terminal domain-containing protein [Candidatus Amulumruptor caecigallinarius]